MARSESRFMKLIDFALVLLLPVLYVSFTTVVRADHCLKKNGGFEVVDPFGFVGDNLSLCCCFALPHNESVQAEDVTFKCGGMKDDSSLFSENYKGVKEKTICSNVTLSSPNQSGMCQCQYRDMHRSSYLDVDERPVADENLNCILYSNKSLICSWFRVNYISPKKVKIYLVTYFMEDSPINAVKTPCSNLAGPCEVHLSIGCPCGDISVSQKIVYTKSSNDVVESVSSWQAFHIPAIIKLPALYVKVENRTKTCLILRIDLSRLKATFISGGSDENKIIQINYSSQWEPDVIQTSNITKLKSSTNDQIVKGLCNLTAYTRYQISLAIKLQSSHYWSDWFNLTEITLEDVPARSPTLVPEAFARLNDESNMAMVYWKLLSPKQWRSDLEQGRFKIYTRDADAVERWHFVDSVNSYTYQSKVQLSKNRATLVKVQSSSNVGCAPEGSQLIIPSKNGALPLPTNVTAIVRDSDSKVTMTWDSTIHADRVVIFWCPSKEDYVCVQNNSTHSSQIEWKVYDDKRVTNNNVSFYPSNFDPILSYIFGISLSQANKSSGIIWAPCVQNAHDSKIYNTCSRKAITNTSQGDDNIILKVIIPIATVFILIVLAVLIRKYILKWRNKSELFQHRGEHMKRSQSIGISQNIRFENGFVPQNLPPKANESEEDSYSKITNRRPWSTDESPYPSTQTTLATTGNSDSGNSSSVSPLDDMADDLSDYESKHHVQKAEDTSVKI